MQISPFSAIISLKKSLVKDKSGALRLPPESTHGQTFQDGESHQDSSSNHVTAALTAK